MGFPVIMVFLPGVRPGKVIDRRDYVFLETKKLWLGKFQLSGFLPPGAMLQE